MDEIELPQPYEQPPALLHPNRLLPILAITIVSALAVIVLRWSALDLLSTAYIGGAEQDAGLYIWLTENNVSWFEGDLAGRLFETNSFYPYGRGLAWSDNYLLPSLIAWPFLRFGFSLPLAWNLISLAVLFLNGWCTSYVSLRLTGRTVASIAAGMLFVSYQSLHGHVGHPQLQWAFYIPLGALFFLKAMKAPTPSAGILLGLLVTATFLTTVYYSLFIVLLCIALWVPLLVARTHQTIKATRTLLWSLPLGLLPLSPFLPPYLEVKDTFGKRGLHESYSFAASLISYLSASPFNNLYGDTSKWSHSEAQLFPGIAALTIFAIGICQALRGVHMWSLVTLVVIATALLSSLSTHTYLLCSIASWCSLALMLFVIWRRRDEGREAQLLGVFVFATLMSVYVSFGPLGLPGDANPPSGIFTLLHLLPGFDALRAVGRVGFLTTWLLSQMVALVLASLPPTRLGYLLTLSLSGLLVMENYNNVLPLQTETPPLPILESLKSQPGGAVVFLPFTETITPEGKVKSWSNFSKLNVHYMRWGLSARKPVVNGYSGQRSKIMLDYPGLLKSFPSSESVAPLLRIAGLRYVLYCNRFAKHPLSLQVDQRLKLIDQDGEGNQLYRVDDERKLLQKEELLVPPNYGSTLELELSATTPFAQVEVAFGEGGKQIITLPKADEWTNFIIQLPEERERVRPLRLILTTKDEVSLRNVTPARIR